jgi:hypothetical protein
MIERYNEPWQRNADSKFSRTIVWGSAGPGHGAMCDTSPNTAPSQAQIERADRIAACVNYFAGVPTEMVIQLTTHQRAGESIADRTKRLVTELLDNENALIETLTANQPLLDKLADLIGRPAAKLKAESPTAAHFDTKR